MPVFRKLYAVVRDEGRSPLIFDTEEEATRCLNEHNDEPERDNDGDWMAGPYAIIVPGPDPQELLEHLDNVTATLETLLTWYGSTMPPADCKARTTLANAARAICDKHLRPETSHVE
jgi:hypothetical protein